MRNKEGKLASPIQCRGVVLTVIQKRLAEMMQPVVHCIGLRATPDTSPPHLQSFHLSMHELRHHTLVNIFGPHQPL